MLFYFLLWPVLGASAFLFGTAILLLMGCAPAWERRSADGALAATWAGLAGFGSSFAFLAQFVPLSPAVGIAVLACPFILLLQPSVRRRARAVTVLVFANRSVAVRDLALYSAAILPVAYVAADQITLFDTAYYHLALARTFEAFGAVTGLSVLHLIFGQVSVWFALAAPASGGGEAPWAGAMANFFIAGLGALHAGAAIRRWAGTRLVHGDIVAAIGFPLVLCFAARWGMISSLSPDLPIMLLCIAVGWAVSLVPSRPEGISPWLTVGVILSVFALSLKVSSAPLFVVVSITLFVHGIRTRRRLMQHLLLGVVLITPSILLSVITTGCVAFPAVVSCLDMPWTMPTERMREHMQLIVDAARAGGMAAPEGASVWDVFTSWVREDRSGAIIVVTGTIFAACALAATAVSRRRAASLETQVSPWAIAIACVGIFYVAYSAPTGRFVGGYAALAAALFFAQVPVLRTGTVAVCRTVAGVFVIVFLVLHQSGAPASVRDLIDMRVAEKIYPDPGNGLILPRRILPFDVQYIDRPALTRWRPVAAPFQDLSTPTRNGECWAAPPPCVPQFTPAGKRYRNPAAGAAGGFEFNRDS